MKNITEKMLNRLAAQAEEAETIGEIHVAEHLTFQIEKNASVTSSIYNSDEYDDDIEKCIWDAVVATASYHTSSFDALKMQGLVEFYAEEIKTAIRKSMGIKTALGSSENKLPGEE